MAALIDERLGADAMADGMMVVSTVDACAVRLPN